MKDAAPAALLGIIPRELDGRGVHFLSIIFFSYKEVLVTVFRKVFIFILNHRTAKQRFNNTVINDKVK